MRRQRAAGDEAIADRRTMGRLRSLHRPLERRPAAQRIGPGAPAADGTDVKFEGADHGAHHLKPVLPDTSRVDLKFERALPLALAADPAAQILIAYEMNRSKSSPSRSSASS